LNALQLFAGFCVSLHCSGVDLVVMQSAQFDRMLQKRTDCIVGTEDEFEFGKKASDTLAEESKAEMDALSTRATESGGFSALVRRGTPCLVSVM
jgi:hypothetical protein